MKQKDKNQLNTKFNNSNAYKIVLTSISECMKSHSTKVCADSKVDKAIVKSIGWAFDRLQVNNRIIPNFLLFITTIRNFCVYVMFRVF